MEIMNPIIMHEVAKARQSDLLREAEQRRLVKQARAGKPSLIARFLERLGGLLIKIGGQLQKRPAPQSTRTLGWAEE
jgi:hypothetical protein